MDYLSAHINNHACALCVEKGMQIEIPERAKVIRVLMDELTRIASHELWWGAMAMDLGASLLSFMLFVKEKPFMISWKKPAAPGLP
jgi:NADH-quinone oxidoreductase subunit D/NADH-quinone oxidoreductase subunit C/D